MTEPSSPRPVPGPPRPGPRPVTPDVPVRSADPLAPDAAGRGYGDKPFADLEQRPVAEHVAVFEAEHARLQRELGAIDSL